MTAHPSAPARPAEGGAESLTELFETDALLDRLGRREPSPLAGTAVDGWLLALAGSVDDHLPEGIDRIAIGALTAGLVAHTDEDAEICGVEAAEVPEVRLPDGPRPAGHRAVRRHGHRWVGVGVGAVLALTGGGWAAAASTNPAEAWGPLRPVVRALHPGWSEQLRTAQRDRILRDLDRAEEQSAQGQKIDAAATYGAARVEATQLPGGPDPVVTAKLTAVGRALGISAPSQPVAAAPAAPTTGTAPVSGAAPGPVPPAPVSTTGTTPPPDGTTPPTDGTATPTPSPSPSGSTPPTDPTAPPATTTPPAGGAGPGAPTTGSNGPSAGSGDPGDGSPSGAAPTSAGSDPGVGAGVGAGVGTGVGAGAGAGAAASGVDGTPVPAAG